MRIAVVSSLPVPLVYGGMNRLLEGLTDALRRRHPTDLVTLPVDERTVEGVVKGYYDFYHMDLSAYDVVISYKAPAYMVSHPVHVLYLSHRMRVFYDLYEPRDASHARVRRLIHWLDNWALSDERIPNRFTIGRTVSRRLIKWGGITSTPIHHPTTFTPVAPRKGEYFFTVGRLHAWKRFDLVIHAMRASKADVPLLIAGTGPDEEKLRQLAEGDPRIQFLGHVSEEQLQEAYAGAIATLFPPINEDLGMITWESFLAGKPVLTTTDSGEPAEIVVPGKTGFVTEPTPEAIAERLDWMAAHRAATEAMSEDCLARAAEVTWDRLVDALLEAAEKTRLAHAGRGARPKGVGAKAAGETAPAVYSPGGIGERDARDEWDERDKGTGDKIHLLVTDNQIIDPPVGGGRIRIWELYRNLPEEFITTYIGAWDHPGPTFRDQWLAPNFREIVMPLTTPHFKAHEVWRRLTGGDATIDVTIPLLLGRFSPRYHRLLREHIDWAHVLICAHPWMFPFLPPTNGLPKVYDSQNCEAVVKGALLRRTLAGRWLARRVERTENAAIRGTHVTLACSETDAAEFTRRYHVEPERIALVPNGVSCRRIRPGAPEEKQELRVRLGLPRGPVALFVGSQYQPNLIAAEFIIKTMAPALPNVFFGIIGGVGEMWKQRNPGTEPPPNVRLFGFVGEAELGELYRAADFGVNPMTCGSGTNIKMLDFMAAGLAILTTETGARGLAGSAGVEWRQAELEEFVPALQAMTVVLDQGRALGEAARKLAETEYDWPIISGRLAERLHELIGAERK